LFESVEVGLRDGRTVIVRAIRPDDRDQLQAAIRRLSPHSRYTRFFSPLRELPPQLLERATHPDAERELQLVAVAGTGAAEQIIAGARYAATAEAGTCEFAVAVVDEWHGLGLARQLLAMLMRSARTRGFAHMEGYVLASNVAMLGLAERLGFVPVQSPEGPTVCLVRSDLGTPT
jgi:GNAT superfamily N-acetyltransferase